MTAYQDDGVQFMDVSDPSNPTAVAAVTHGGSFVLDGAEGVATFTIGGSTYAAVTSYLDDTVQLIDVSTPSSPTAVSQAVDGAGGFTTLNGARGVAIFTIGASTYAIVAAAQDHGVQMIDVSDPSSPTAVAAVTTGGGFVLNGATGVATFTIGGSTFAAVTSFSGDTVQLIDVSTPSSPTAVSQAVDDAGGFTALDGPRGVAIFTIGGSTYAIVVSAIDDGVQLIDVSDPSSPTAMFAATDGTSPYEELNGAWGVATFSISGRTFALVAASVDDSLTLIDVRDQGSHTASSTMPAPCTATAVSNQASHSAPPHPHARHPMHSAPHSAALTVLWCAWHR